MQRNNVMVPHVFKMTVCGYTNRLDSDSTYESNSSLDMVHRMVHFASARTASHCSRTRLRRPMTGPLIVENSSSRTCGQRGTGRA